MKNIFVMYMNVLQNNKMFYIEKLPVLKFTTMSMRNIVSERQLKAIHRVLRSSLKKLMATGKIIKFATSNSNIQRSQQNLKQQKHKIYI